MLEKSQSQSVTVMMDEQKAYTGLAHTLNIWDLELRINVRVM